jgi:hypothetical protein
MKDFMTQKDLGYVGEIASDNPVEMLFVYYEGGIPLMRIAPYRVAMDGRERKRRENIGKLRRGEVTHGANPENTGFYHTDKRFFEDPFLASHSTIVPDESIIYREGLKILLLGMATGYFTYTTSDVKVKDDIVIDGNLVFSKKMPMGDLDNALRIIVLLPAQQRRTLLSKLEERVKGSKILQAKSKRILKGEFKRKLKSSGNGALFEFGYQYLQEYVDNF